MVWRVLFCSSIFFFPLNVLLYGFVSVHGRVCSFLFYSFIVSTSRIYHDLLTDLTLVTRFAFTELCTEYLWSYAIASVNK